MSMYASTRYLRTCIRCGEPDSSYCLKDSNRSVDALSQDPAYQSCPCKVGRGHTLHHPHFATAFSNHTHDPWMGDCILDFHRGTVYLLWFQLSPGPTQVAYLQLPSLFEITVHLDFNCVELQYCASDRTLLV